ncbi:MAG: PAS domain-containing protein [Opitutaceae bacterium]|nr:PAS domain-containing protein [Opitutaceae bacterium]
MKPHDTTAKGDGAEERWRKLHVEADAWFRSMAEAVDDVFWISASGGRELLYVSPAYERIWDRSLAELYANPHQWVDAVVPEDKAGVLEAREQLAGGKEYRIEYRIRRRDGTLRWIEGRSYPIREPAGELHRAVGVARDITRRKQLEAQLLHSQKMEAVGQLAGGIAHDFNNVLTVVTGYARLLLDGGMMPPDAVEGLTQIYTAGARATNLTRQLLLFSRKQTANCRVVDFNRIVDEIAQILHRLIGEHIGLKLQLSSAPAWVEADPGMMEQVLMNLAVNARDVMTNGGALTIGTETVRIDDAWSRHHPSARSGEFVILSVRDSPAAAFRRRIFSASSNRSLRRRTLGAARGSASQPCSAS